jgi:hypothetical protein
MNSGIGFRGLGLKEGPLMGSKMSTHITDSELSLKSVETLLTVRSSASTPYSFLWVLCWLEEN